MKTHQIFILFIAAILVVYPQKKNHTAMTHEMVKVEGGTFQMGSSEDSDHAKPVHNVTLSSFLIGKYEVTQELWESVMGNNPSNFKGLKRPVEKVSWYDAVEFCNKLSKIEGLKPAYKVDKTRKDPHNTSNYEELKWLVICDFSSNGYRLPTEAEWEFAAKGGNKSEGYKFSGSNEVDVVAWYDNNSKGGTYEVGKKQPNELGLYDMSGNIWEWCWDWFGTYSAGNQTNPKGASAGSYRVLRGGSWYKIVEYSCRATNRESTNPDYSDLGGGFRIARTK